MLPFRTLFGILAIVLPLLCLGCGGGGELTASGGIGGSGNLDTSVGTVSAVGSITVNGVTFETDTATVIIDDQTAPDDSGLRVGMVVEVRGTINADGVTGSAETVDVTTAISGPVEAITSGTLTLLGQTVLIDAQTLFDAETIAPPSIDGLEVGDLIAVSGLPQSNGGIRATRIEKQDTGDANLQVTGFVSNLTAITFTIGNLTIDYGQAALEDFDGQALMAGNYVEVRGSLNSGNVLLAERIKRQERDYDDGELAEFEGVISAADEPVYTMVTAVGPVTFRIGPNTLFDEGSPMDLIIGAEVEVEGEFSGDILGAEVIEVEALTDPDDSDADDVDVGDSDDESDLDGDD
ncbi:MAG: DUF5666 domain-containing protein [Desulfosarcinaceae bacterium]|nr:DUF5666 domain-containing protein [Desulfosarcinaceae bacterium]